MLDLETTNRRPDAAQNVQSVGQFLHVVEKATDVRCFLYISDGCWSSSLDGTAGFAGHPLWSAVVSQRRERAAPDGEPPPIVQPPPPQIPRGGRGRSGSTARPGQVPGISTEVGPRRVQRQPRRVAGALPEVAQPTSPSQS